MTITQSKLEQFTSAFSVYSLPNLTDLKITDGIRYLSDHGVEWLILAIFKYQSNCQIQNYLKNHNFIRWVLTVNPNQSATLTADNFIGDVIKIWKIAQTTFPLPELKLYQIEGILMLSSEN